MSFNSPINLRKKEVPVNGTSFLYNQPEYVPDFGVASGVILLYNNHRMLLAGGGNEGNV